MCGIATVKREFSHEVMRTIVNKVNLPASLIAAFRSNFENIFDSTESVYTKRNEKYIKTKYLPKTVQQWVNLHLIVSNREYLTVSLQRKNWRLHNHSI